MSRKIVSEKDFWGVGDNNEDDDNTYGDESWTQNHHRIVTDSDDEAHYQSYAQYDDDEEFERVNQQSQLRSQQQQQKKNQQNRRVAAPVQYSSTEEEEEQSSEEDDTYANKKPKLQLYEVTDDGFTTFVGKKAATEKLAQKVKTVKPSKNDDEEEDNEEQKNKKKKNKKKKKDAATTLQQVLTRKIDPRDPLAGVDDPYDLLAEQHNAKIRMKADEQKLAYQKKMKKQKAMMPTSHQPVGLSKAEKNKKLSGITKLVFEQPNKSNEKQQKKKKSQTKESTPTTTAAEKVAPAKTIAAVAASLSAKDLDTTIENVRKMYSKESATQFIQVAGWFEKEFYHLSEKNIPSDSIRHFSKQFVARMEKWLALFHDKNVTEAVTLFIGEIYSDKGIERHPGKSVGTRVFLQFIFHSRPMPAADGIAACSSKFANGAVSLQNLKVLLDSLLSQNELAGIKAATAVILTHILSKKLKSKEEQEAIAYLRSLIETDRIMRHTEQNPEVPSLVDKKQFFNFQNFAFSSKNENIQSLYQDVVAVSIFLTNNSPSLFFIQQLEALKATSAEERREEIASILSKSLKIDEECITLWVNNMSKYIKESTILLEHINKHGGLQGVKGNERISKQISSIIQSSDKSAPHIQALQEQLKSYKITNAESSIVGAFFRFIFVILVLSALAILATMFYCGSNHETQFCKVNEQWLSAFTSILQDRQ